MPTAVELFKMANEILTPADLVPIEKLADNAIWKEYNDKALYKIPDYETITKAVEYLGKDSRNFYFCTKGLISNFCYFKGCVFVDMPSLDMECISTLNYKKIIDEREQIVEEWIKNKDFQRYFSLLDNKVAYWVFREMFDQIPDDQKYEIFIHIYTTSEYGFHVMDKEFVKKVFSYKKKDKSLKNLIRKFGDVDADNNLTIYRGACSESGGIDSFSWTIDINTALNFATRFGIESKVFKAKVNLNHVVDYIKNMNEKEIIILPENLIAPHVIPLHSFLELQDEMEEEGLASVYRENANTRLKKRWFDTPDSIHGMRHTKRVLLLSIMLAYFKGLDSWDTDILIEASLLHDIGRHNDDVCLVHGRDSYKKADSLEIIEITEDCEDEKILKFIIENHCIDDKDALKCLEQYGIEDTYRAKQLFFVFKDADALDRCRLKDIDVRFFRNKEAKDLLLFAYQILQGIR